MGRYKPVFIGIMEDQINYVKVNACHKLFGRHWYLNINPASGQVGGIICLWKDKLG